MRQKKRPSLHLHRSGDCHFPPVSTPHPSPHPTLGHAPSLAWKNAAGVGEGSCSAGAGFPLSTVCFLCLCPFAFACQHLVSPRLSPTVLACVRASCGPPVIPPPPLSVICLLQSPPPLSSPPLSVVCLLQSPHRVIPPPLFLVSACCSHPPCHPPPLSVVCLLQTPNPLTSSAPFVYSLTFWLKPTSRSVCLSTLAFSYRHPPPNPKPPNPHPSRPSMCLCVQQRLASVLSSD